MEMAAQDVADLSLRSKQSKTPVHNVRDKTKSVYEIFDVEETTMQPNAISIMLSVEHVAKKATWQVCRTSKQKPQTSTQPKRPNSGSSKSRHSPNRQFLTHTMDQEPHPTSPESSDPETDYPLFTLPSTSKPIMVTVQANKVDIVMELDTGASLFLLSESTYSSVCNTLPPLSPSHVTLTTYTGESFLL